jgi:putative DNA primase/helicase
MQNDNVQVAVDVADSVEVRQLMQEVVKATAVYSRNGKPDLEKAQRQRAIELRISDEGIAAQWKQAKQNWHRVWLRKLAFGGAAKAEVKPKPKPREKPEDEEGLPKDQGSPSSFGKGGFAGKLEDALGGNAKRILSGIKAQRAEPEPELDAPPTAPVVEEIIWSQPKLGTAPVLSRIDPMENARAFARDRLRLNDVLATYFYHEDWWQWNARFYERAPEQRIRGEVYTYMDQAVAKGEDGDKKFRPRGKEADELIKFLKGCVTLDDRIAPPTWLDGRTSPPAENLLIFRNCMVDAVNGKPYPLDPRLWTHDGVDFDFNPNARCPKWEWFLEQVFPGDVESQMTIEEQLGLGMTYDYQFERAAGWIGVTRSGKGTFAHIQELLVGPNGHTPLNIHKWRSTENSLEPLIGKKVGIFHDLRAKPAKAFGTVGYDPGGIDYESAQMLLQLIAADTASLPRKFKQAWKGKPTWKIILISNKVPNFQDAILAEQRFVWLDFKQSFADHVDPRIKHVWLPAELSGIANRCLAGYRRLLDRGRFIQPKSAEALTSKVKEAVNPFLGFMNECWIKDHESGGPTVGDFFETFLQWCREHQRWDLTHSVTRNNLITFITKIEEWKHLHSVKPKGKSRRYPGLRCKNRMNEF